MISPAGRCQSLPLYGALADQVMLSAHMLLSWGHFQELFSQRGVILPKSWFMRLYAFAVFEVFKWLSFPWQPFNCGTVSGNCMLFTNNSFSFIKVKSQCLVLFILHSAYEMTPWISVNHQGCQSSLEDSTVNTHGLWTVALSPSSPNMGEEVAPQLHRQWTGKER